MSDSQESSVYIKMRYSKGDYEVQILVHEWGLLCEILTVGRLIRDLVVVFSYSFQIGAQLINYVVFQVYSKVICLHINMCLFFFKFFPHLGYYRILSRVPCAL